jgi:hypothetical protein
MSGSANERGAPDKTLEDLYREGQLGEFDHLKELSDDHPNTPKKEDNKEN